MEICRKLVDEDWSIDNLRTELKGGAITPAIWERYGFRMGTLAKIQSTISEFKRFRSSTGSVLSQTTDDSES
jgi:hypothetical protein